MASFNEELDAAKSLMSEAGATIHEALSAQTEAYLIAVKVYGEADPGTDERKHAYDLMVSIPKGQTSLRDARGEQPMSTDGVQKLTSVVAPTRRIPTAGRTHKSKPRDFRNDSIRSITHVRRDEFILAMPNGNYHRVSVEEIGKDWLRLHNKFTALASESD